MKRILSISILALAVIGLYFFSTNVEAFRDPYKPKDPFDGAGPGSGGSCTRSGCECHSLDC